MSSSPLKLVMFDFDGTLVDSLQFGFKLFQECGKKYHFHAIETYQEYQRLQRLSLLQIILQLRLSPFTLRRIVRENLSSAEQLLDQCLPYPNIEDTLKALSASFQLAIISTNLREAIEQYLRTHNLQSYFQQVIGTETSSDKRRKMRICLENHQADPQCALYIGDSVRDIRDAKAERVPVIAVTYGIHDEATLVAEKPDFVAHTPAEILSIVTTYST